MVRLFWQLRGCYTYHPWPCTRIKINCVATKHGDFPSETRIDGDDDDTRAVLTHPPPSIALAIQARGVIKIHKLWRITYKLPHCFAHQKSCNEKVPKCYASLGVIHSWVISELTIEETVGTLRGINHFKTESKYACRIKCIKATEHKSISPRTATSLPFLSSSSLLPPQQTLALLLMTAPC